MRRLFLAALLLAIPARGGTVEPVVEARTAGGVLSRYGPQRVLVVRGSARERGLAHGRLLAREVRENTRAFLDEWALGRMGRTRAELRAIWEALRVPATYRAELRGLAEGSGVPLADLELLHAIPSRYHCTGTAVLPEVTRDGKVYHTRSLDYALDIGDTVRPQTNALLLVSVPDDGIPHAIVSWAGFLGCVTGMNAKGVSVGEMGSRSRDETWDGVPMIFLLRETLRTCASVAAAKRLWRESPRTCGYNFIFCDPAEICAVECNRSRIRFFAPGEAVDAPHAPIPGVVRRCNHFVDRELAATQRKGYDPRKHAANSWAAYDLQGRFLAERAGSIDGEAMLGVLRTYPATHPCLHQAVMCPTDLSLWVAHAADPAVDPLAGAQNQAFVRYDLADLVKGGAGAVEVTGPDRTPPEGIETGTAPDAPAIEGVFAHRPAPFAWRLAPLSALGGVTIHHLAFPSPGPSPHPENLTVHAEYYRPAGAGPFPSVVVLHILDGRFYVARLVANTLAQQGIAALFVQLPYYGRRRPAQGLDPARVDVPDVVDGIRQAVRDVRRAGAWLRARPEVAAGRVGIVGVSLGSFVAQLAAGADGGFDRCAFVLGGGSITETVFAGSKDTRKIEALLRERGWPPERLAEALAPVEPLAHVGGVKARQAGVLMINCRADEVVPPASSRAYWEAAGRPAIVWYDGGHYALKNHVFDVLARLTRHFR